MEEKYRLRFIYLGKHGPKKIECPTGNKWRYNSSILYTRGLYKVFKQINLLDKGKMASPAIND